MIYRGIRLLDEQPVVVKVSAHTALTEKKAQRFQHEFEIGRQIHSPHVVRYLELMQDSSYGIALVMEDDQATDLTSHIPAQGFSTEEFLKIAIQIVQGLQAIHEVNIIHNDLKPSNILILPTSGQIKITDFNQASSLRQEMQLALSNNAEVGTLAYISPEQTGRINRSVDYRTDFYSLGVTFYYLLCGQLPFMANDALELIHQHLAKQPLPPNHVKSAIAPPLSLLVMKLLEKEAEHRYQSCEGILHDLNYCLSVLRESGDIPTFTLGEHDFSPKLTLSQHLYGRENELNILTKTFARVSQGNREVIMVAGQPGVGKSMLIQELQKPITLQNGYFIAGKFDQLNKNVAYSALTQAFESLIKQILTEDEISINYWKKKLFEALGSQAQLVIQIVPSLALLIGQQNAAQIANVSQAKTILHFVFLDFIQAFANNRPLVLLLDDLQWADNASLELMTYLMQQPRIKHLLWIGAYRDTEVTGLHPLLQTIATLQEEQIKIQTITLTSLTPENLQQWISDSLHMSLEDTVSLAEIIQQKTDGNPFFVKMFLQALYDNRLLTFSPKNYCWQWDLSKILQYPATENVITLMIYQLQQLPSPTQMALSTASCLGHKFLLSTFQIAMACTLDQAKKNLYPALQKGIVILIDNEMQFIHDRVQEAAYSLVSESEKILIHLMIGQRFLASDIAEEDLLFDIVAQFNRSQSLITEPQERLRFALLNLKASQKAKQATAYNLALNYLYAVREWINIEDLWQSDYAMAFNLYKELAEMEYLCGHIDISQNLIINTQPHLQFVLDKIEMYHLLITQKTLQGDQQTAIILGHQALQLLGSGLPLDNPKTYIEHELPLLKQRLAEKPLSSLLDAPLTNDPEKQAIFKTLTDIYSACYQLSSELTPAITIMAINLTLNHGLDPESCLSYVGYATLLCTQQFQDYADGFKYAHLAIQLAERLQSSVQACRSKLITYNLIYAWSASIRDLPKLLSSAFDMCLACGEIEYAGYCGAVKLHMLFDQGTPLSTVQKELLAILQFAQSTKTQGVIYNVMSSFQRITANLVEETQSAQDFNYQHVSDADFESECQKSASSNMSLGFYYLRKAQVLYLYNQLEQALEYLDLARSRLIHHTNFYETAIFNWYDSLTRLALYSTVSSEKQQSYLKQVEQNQQQMNRWKASCPENFAHKYFLVEAELARINVNHEMADMQYEQAVMVAGKNNLIHEQALAAELAAKYWLARNKPLFAQGFLNTAFNKYKQWGAKRKIALFKTQYFEVLQELMPPSLSPLAVNQETTLSSNSLKFLDLSSILKVSQAISSEIELPKLLRNIMQLIVETAGAQQGAVLFIEKDDSIVVQAEYALDGTITTLQKIPLSTWSYGSLAVIHYVKRLHQSVVIDNATTHELFKNDLYISQTQAKSILCIPILKYAELKAIVYAENNLISNAFTAEHVQTILILSAQMAISLENAYYFVEQIELARQLAKQSTRAQLAEESLNTVTHNLQLALEASKAGTWNWQIDTDVVTWDNNNYALFGLKPGEFKGTYVDVIEHVHPDDRVELAQNIKRCIEEDILHDMEFRVIWPDGSQHVISGKGRVYRDKNGHPLKMAGVCIDITQRKQLEEERMQALKQAEEKERHRAEESEKYRKNLQDFIDMVCHEIRNPMSGIYGNIDIQQQTIASLKALNNEMQPTHNKLIHELTKSTQEIQQCVKHQKTIIDDVLDLSKLESGKIELAHQPFNLKNLIKDVIKIYIAPLEQKKLSLKLVMPEIDFWVKGDVNRLKMVLINLVGNALKFTEHGEIKINLQVVSVSSTHTTFALIVEDTGIGMTADQQSQLFQRFARVASTEYQGSGLGLLISKQFVERMGGTIEVKSEKGKGSQFTLRLTCETATAEAKSIPLAAETTSAPSSQILPKRILVVEDNVINQRILCKLLKDAGYHCESANNGREAIDKWSTASFDLIFMDIEMPIMGGLEATQIIRQRENQLANTKRIPIIALSAYTSKDYIQQASTAGMDEYITKPYEKGSLYQMARKWITYADTISGISQTTISKPSPSATFWKDPPSTGVTQPVRNWTLEERRNALYFLLDKLSDAFNLLNISIIQVKAKDQEKTSRTGWQLHSLKDTADCWAVLNVGSETQVDDLINIIHRNNTQLQTIKMISSSNYALAIIFSNNALLNEDVEKIISSIRMQTSFCPMVH